MRSLKKKMKNKMKTMKNTKFNGGMFNTLLRPDGLKSPNKMETHEQHDVKESITTPGQVSNNEENNSNDESLSNVSNDDSRLGNNSYLSEGEYTNVTPDSNLADQSPKHIKEYCEWVHNQINLLGNDDPNAKPIIESLLTAKEPNAYVKNALAALLIEICDRPEDQEEAMGGADFSKYWYEKISDLSSIGDKLEQIIQLVDVTQDMSTEDNYRFLRNAQRDYNYSLYKGIIISYETEKVIAEIIGIIENIAHKPDIERLQQLFNRMGLEELKQHLLTYKKIEKLWKNSKLDKIVIHGEPNDILRLITHYIRSKSLIELLKNKAGKQELLRRLSHQIQLQGDEFKREIQKLAEKVEICCESKNKGKDAQLHIKRDRDVDVDVFNQPSPSSVERRTRAKASAPGLPIPVQRVATTTIVSGLYIARILHFICQYLLLHDYLINPQIFTFMEEMNHLLENLNKDDNIIILSSSRFLLSLNLFVKFINENEPFDHHPHVLIEAALRNIDGDGGGGAGGRVSP